MRELSVIDNSTKIMFIEEIHKYPEIWDNRNRSVIRTEKWTDIGKKFGLPPRMARILWAAFRRHYFDLLLIKTIERDNSSCRWPLFHHMSFIYEHIKILIKKKMGGIAPPLLKSDDNPKLPCPCCIPVPTDHGNCSSSSKTSINEPAGITQPRIEVNNSSETLNMKQDGSKNPLKRSIDSSGPPVKNRRSVYSSSKDRRSIERANIIDAIRDYPVLYAKDSPIPKCSLSFAWKSVAEKVALPLLIIQNRWRLFKRRYVEELMRQRYSNGEFHSKWENFEQMSFMRDHMKADIANIDKIRKEIQQIVEEQKGRQTIDLCADEDEVFPIENENTDYDTSHEDKPNNQSTHNPEPHPKVALRGIESPTQDLQSALLVDGQPSKDESKKEPAMLTLDLISDEEDNSEQVSIVSLDDDMDGDLSFESEVYEQEIVYFEESIKDNVICIDDDTEDE